jgi:hypothetical protein
VKQKLCAEAAVYHEPKMVEHEKRNGEMSGRSFHRHLQQSNQHEQVMESVLFLKSRRKPSSVDTINPLAPESNAQWEMHLNWNLHAICIREDIKPDVQWSEHHTALWVYLMLGIKGLMRFFILELSSILTTPADANRTRMTNTYYCVYSVEILLMVGSGHVRNM